MKNTTDKKRRFTDGNKVNVEPILYPKEIGGALKEGHILLNFSGQEVYSDVNKESKQCKYSIVFPTEDYLGILEHLVKIGMEYEKQYDKNIGFGFTETLDSEGGGGCE